MIQRLIILGLLKKGPATGYDIKKFITTDLGVFSEFQNQSIYYPLKKMEKEALIVKKESKDKGHLKKYSYTITAKGQREFMKLCRETLLSQQRPFIELDIALYFLPFLNKKEIMPLLRLRMRFLEKVKQWLENKEEELRGAPRNLMLLIDHQFTLAGAEKEFLSNMIDTIKKEKGNK
jgi:DNA-binding PadR family transcriptional regulator